MKPRKIVFYSPLPASHLEGFWHRDNGLLVRTALEAGYAAQFVCHGPASGNTHRDLLPAPPDALLDSRWWSSLGAWAIVFNTWGASRFHPVWRAALRATPRFLERLDTDGIRSPRVEPRLFFYQFWSRLHDTHGHRFGPWIAPPIALLQGSAHFFFPRFLDREVCRGLAGLPLVTAESPGAVERIRRLLRAFGHSGSNAHVLPHPVDVEGLDLPSAGDKENLIISVGRWDSHQKNFPMLQTVLCDFLAANPDWSASVCGPYSERTISTMPPGLVAMSGAIDHKRVIDAMRRAKIFLMTSRHESFGIAAAEALCQGCSVVGPAHIPSVRWFTSDHSGTISAKYNTKGMRAALAAEAKAWECGSNRDPKHIANRWRDRLSAQSVFEQLVQLLETIHPRV